MVFEHLKKLYEDQSDQENGIQYEVVDISKEKQINLYNLAFKMGYPYLYRHFMMKLQDDFADLK